MSQERRLNIRVNLDTGTLERDAASATNTLKEIGNEAESQGKRMTSIFKNVGAGVAAAFAIGRIKSFIGEIINVRSEIQSLSVSFETLLGSKEKADQLVGQIRKYAASTPMQMSDLAQGAQTLLGFNIEAKKIMPIMQAIGDISMGNRDKFNSLTLAFAQMSATGKLMGQDLLQMINAGFNPLTVISEQTGKSISTLNDEMSSGAISAKMVEDAFKAATAEGGKFHGMLDRQSKTLRGSISNLQGAFTDMLNDFGSSSEGIIAGGVNAAYEMVKNYKETGEALLALIATVGVYKAAVIAEAALNAAVADTVYTRVAAIGAVNAAQATGIELEIQQAVSKGVLTKAEAEEILMQYQLAKARVADLTALKVQAQAEKESAVVAQAAAASKVQAAEQQVIAANMKYEAALRSGNGEMIERAELALGTAQSELNAASKAHMAAMTNTAAASKRASVAATTADTAAQQLNTLSMNTGSKAAGFLTLAKTQLRNAVTKLYTTMTAHPFAMILAAVVALAYGIYKLCTHETEAEKAQKRLNEAFAQAQGAVATEQAEIKRLFDALKEAKEGTEAYNKAKEDIWSRYGKWLKVLGDENTALLDQAKAYELVARKAQDAAMAKARDAFMEDEGKENAEKMGKIYLKAYNLVKSKLGQEYADKYLSQIRQIISGELTPTESFLAHFNTKETRTAGGSNTYSQTYEVEVNTMQQYIDEGTQQMRQLNDIAHRADIMFGSAEDPGDGAAENSVNFSEQLANAKKTRDTAKKDWQELAKSASSTKAQVEAAYKAYTTAQSTYADLLEMRTGKKENSGNGGGTDVASQKIEDIEDKNFRDREKAAYQRQLELEQLKIDAMADGSEKRLAQMRLDNKKEESQLDQQLNDAIAAEVERQRKEWDATEAANEKAAAAAKTSYQRKAFSAGNILRQIYSPDSGDVTEIEGIDGGNVNTDEINNIIDDYRAMSDEMAKIHEERLREFAFEELQSLRDYLTAYGSAKEQELAITQEYDRKIAATNDEMQIKLLKRERDEKISKTQADEVSNRASWISQIGDFGGMFRGVMEAAADELARYMQTDKFKNLDKDTRQKMQEQYAGMRQKLGDTGGLDFSKLQKQLQDYERAMKKYTDAQEEHEQSVKELEIAQNNYQKVLEDDTATDDAREAAKAALETATEQADKTREAMEEAEGVAKQAGNTAGATARILEENMSKVTSGLQQLSSGSLASAYQGLIQFGKGAGGLMGKIAEKLEATPIVGWALQLVDILRDGMAPLITALIDSLYSAVGNIMSETLSGKFMTNILESFWHGVTGMWRGWGDTLGSIFGKSNEKEVAELTERLTESNERLRDAVDGLKDEISESGGWRAITAAQQARDDQQKIIDQTAVILESQMRKHGSHSSNAKNWNLNESEYASLNATLADFQRRFGGELTQVFSLEDILKLSPEQMDYIRKYNVEMWQRMTSIGKYDVTDAWDQYADLAGAMDEIQKTLKETMTQISFDSMRDSFLSDLMQMDKKASDFGNNLREYLMKAVLNAKLSDLLDEDLQAFYDKWAEYMESGNELDDREIAELQALYDDIVSRGLEIRDQAAAITGYDKTASNSGSGTTGSFATASQDSITELSGRAAAIHTSGEMRRELLLNIGVDVAELKAQAAANAANSAEMRELQLIAVGHLETIARNTNELYEMNERLGKIESNTRGL